jgi:hypothetical protein
MVQDLVSLKRVLMSLKDKPQGRAILLLFCCLLLYKYTSLVFRSHFYRLSELINFELSFLQTLLGEVN